MRFIIIAVVHKVITFSSSVTHVVMERIHVKVFLFVFRYIGHPGLNWHSVWLSCAIKIYLLRKSKNHHLDDGIKSEDLPQNGVLTELALDRDVCGN